MIHIITSDRFSQEKKFVFDFVFKESFGSSYDIEYKSINGYQVHSQNGQQVHFPDIFFDRSDYTKLDILPQKVEWITDHEICEFTIPIIFGSYHVQDVNQRLEVGFDLFGTIFFFLSLLEETVSSHLDIHERFDHHNSFAYKSKLYQVPTVDIYLSIIKKVLSLSFQNRYEVIPSHDVDHIHIYPDPLLGSLKRNFLKSKGCINRLVSPLKEIYTRLQNNYINSYEYVANLSEQNNLRSEFYLMSSEKTPFDDGHDFREIPRYRQRFQSLGQKGHSFAFHPSYKTSSDSTLWNKEYQTFLSRLEEVGISPIPVARQHYLRIELPKTYDIMASCDIETDTSLTFPDDIGFRTGTSRTFQYFSLKTRETLPLKIRPLLIMDLAAKRLAEQQGIQYTLKRMHSIKKFTQNLSGQLTLLTHLNYNESDIFPGWQQAYLDLICE